MSEFPRTDVQLLTIDEVASILRVSKQAIRRWTNDGLLSCVRLPNGHRRFRVSDIDKFIAGGSDANQAKE